MSRSYFKSFVGFSLLKENRKILNIPIRLCINYPQFSSKAFSTATLAFNSLLSDTLLSHKCCFFTPPQESCLRYVLSLKRFLFFHNFLLSLAASYVLFRCHLKYYYFGEAFPNYSVYDHPYYTVALCLIMCQMLISLTSS